MAKKSTKLFLLTVAAVFVGIWFFSRLKKKTATTGGNNPVGDTYYGPDVDPKTGTYLGPGARPGSTSFPSQPFSSGN